MRDETRRKLHNKGQQDAAKNFGNHRPPHSWWLGILSDKVAAENKVYDEGYRHGATQRKKR